MQNQEALDDLNQALECDAFCMEALLLRSQVTMAIFQSKGWRLNARLVCRICSTSQAQYCTAKKLVCVQAHREVGAFESSFLDLQRLSQLPHGLDDMLARLQAAAALCLSTSGAQAHVRPACEIPGVPWITQ